VKYLPLNFICWKFLLLMICWRYLPLNLFDLWEIPTPELH
jgi:hypothetical protein